jgi:hypothetical protein
MKSKAVNLVRVRKNFYVNPADVNYIEVKGTGFVRCLIGGEPFMFHPDEFKALKPYIGCDNAKKAFEIE